MTGESLSIVTEEEPSGVAKGESVALLIARRVAFETEEWIPPQRPLSEETTIKSLRAEDLSSVATLKTSNYRVQSVDIERGNSNSNSPELASPYSLPACIALCAFASFVEAIIFIDYRKCVSRYSVNIEFITDLGDFLDISDGLEP